MVDMQKLLEVEVKEKKVLFISPLKNVGSQQKVILTNYGLNQFINQNLYYYVFETLLCTLSYVKKEREI